jgi:hypothetical protein
MCASPVVNQLSTSAGQRGSTAAIIVSMDSIRASCSARDGQALEWAGEHATSGNRDAAQGEGASVSASSTHRAKAALRRPGVWVALVGVFLLSSCTANIDGYVGVTVDSKNGHAQALVQSCKHSMYVATIYRSDDPKGGDSQHADIGDWKFSRSTVGQPITWPVDATRAEGVQATVPIKRMVPRRTYSLVGGTKDNSWSTAHVRFTLEDLKALKPGLVLVLDSQSHHREVSVKQFSDLACDGN